MKIIYLILLSIICFSCVLLGGKKFRSTTLYALAIGGAVNANFFNSSTYPIQCFNLPFGIDSIIYTLFIFCVIVMYFHEGKSSAYVLTFSSLIAIMFSAIMQLIVSLLTAGSSVQVWLNFADFTISCVASFVAIWIILTLIEIMQNKNINKYIIITLAIILASVVDSGIYIGLSTIINGEIFNLIYLLLASFIGKMIAIICALVSFYFLNLYDKKHDKQIISN